MDEELTRVLVPIGHVDALGPCRYREHRLPEVAPQAVAAVWHSQVCHTATLRVVPDGCIELVRGNDGTVEIWGPADRPRHVRVEKHAEYDGVRLKAGTALSVLGVPAHVIAGRVVAANDLGARGWRTEPDRSQWLTRVLALAESGTRTWLRDPVASMAPGLLSRLGIADAAARLHISERQLRRSFGARVGLSPSAYRRLARTRQALRDLRSQEVANQPSIADIAHRHGYTDQPHFTRQVVALTGLPPRALQRLTALTEYVR